MPKFLEEESHGIGELQLFLNNLHILAFNFAPVVTEILKRTLGLNKLKISSLHMGLELSAFLGCLSLLHGLKTLYIVVASGPLIFSKIFSCLISSN